MNHPAVSVIVPSYNAARTISGCLESLQRQSSPEPFEIIVVDSSSDGTAQLVINLDKSLEGRGLHAGEMIREAAAMIGGGGGGRPTMARAGGGDAARLPDALAAAERLILERLS